MVFKSNFFHWIENFNDLRNLTQISNMTALICAATKGYIDIVELLLKQKGIDINMKDTLN